MTHEPRQRGMWRSRWAAIGAAVAVTLGGGTGLLTVAAAGEPSVLVNVTPTRVLDTRIDIGLAGPNTTGVGRLLDVTGTIPIVLPGDIAGTALVVPDNATAIVANLTAVAPTASGFVSIRPGDATGTPTTSNINIANAGGAVPNSITVPIHTDGTVNLYYFGVTPDATTHLLLDIVGYYQPGGTGTPGPAGPAGPTGPAGAPGVDPVQVVWVAKSGGDFTTLAAAMASITDATATKPYVIKIAPGEYVEPGGVTVKSFVSIEGSGPEATVVTCACAGPIEAAGAATLRVTTAGAQGIRALTVGNTATAGNSAYGLLVLSTGSSPIELADLDLDVSAANSAATGLHIVGSTVVGNLIDVAVTGNGSLGLGSRNSSVSVRGLSVSSVGTGGANGVRVDGGSGHSFRDVFVTASASNPGASVYGFDALGDMYLDAATVQATGGAGTVGIRVDANVTINDATVSGTTAGVAALFDSTVIITDSFITGATSVLRVTDFFAPVVRIANTRLNGNTSGAPTCFDVYTLSFTPYTCI